MCVYTDIYKCVCMYMYRLTLSSFLALSLVPTILIPQMRFVPSSPSMPNTNLIRNIKNNYGIINKGKKND